MKLPYEAITLREYGAALDGERFVTFKGRLLATSSQTLSDDASHDLVQEVAVYAERPKRGTPEGVWVVFSETLQAAGCGAPVGSSVVRRFRSERTLGDYLASIDAPAVALDLRADD